MAAVTEADLASQFLRELGAPDTPVMRKAVVAWMRKESGNNIIGNNPWNLRPGAASGTGVPYTIRTSTQGNGQFAVFATPQDGVKAAARLLLRAGSDWRHYDGIVSGARSGSPTKFFEGLVKSAWSGTRYGGNTASLMGVYASVTSYNVVLGTDATASGSGGMGTSGGGTFSGGTTGGAPSFVNDPTHVLTAADLQAWEDWLLSGLTGQAAVNLKSYLDGLFFNTGTHPSGGTYVGKTVGDVKAVAPTLWDVNKAQAGATAGAQGPLDLIAGAFGKLFGFAGGMILVILGVFLYSKSVKTRVATEAM